MSSHVFFFGQGKSEGDPKRRDILGGKGAGLAEMTVLGLPVPPGFTISTEACNHYSDKGAHPPGLQDAVAAALKRVEGVMGATFGDAKNPLLVSVRSGARASMPGMMDTILNLGLNDVTVEGLATRTNNPRFAYDAYRRFIAMYGSVAMGASKEPFEHVLDEARQRLVKARGMAVTAMNAEELRRVLPDSELPLEELKTVVAQFKAVVQKETGSPFPSDPQAQLWGAIEAVFGSWGNHRAVVYRKMHDIPASWGTACNIQSMVFGNMGDTSATGVCFTRDPSTGEKRVFGEWLPNAQGEDVVAGIRTPLPVGAGTPGTKGNSLEERMPKPHGELMRMCAVLEKHFRDMQDVEFTIQDGTLWMLQCRNGKRAARAAVRLAVEMVKEGLITEDEAVLRVDPTSLNQLLHPTLDPSAPRNQLAAGLGASPGAASGHIVFSADDAEKQGELGKPVILVRVDTSPEDIHGMKAARGILTARGGMTSHAAVVARGMGKPCVAGCSALAINYALGQMTITLYDEKGNPKGSTMLKQGDIITMDGGTGQVFLGPVPTVNATLSGDFAQLMAWADARRTLKVRANADTPLDAHTARGFGAQGIGLCRTEHMFFDEARIAAVREMILSDNVDQRQHALAKLLPFQKEDFVGLFREMKGLPVTIRLLDPPLHEFLPHKPEQLAQLARDMKVTVEKLQQRVSELHEFNPMLGHRGCRLAVTFPEIYEMQVRAILEAARQVQKEGLGVEPEIMIPLTISLPELNRMKVLVDKVAKEVFGAGDAVPFKFGTMIEIPRAALLADELAQTAEFFSFGTNDLTQCTLGLSRDDAGKFLPSYVDSALLPRDPFVSIDQEGVGSLVKTACEKGRKARPDIKLGVCGEHGGDPQSVEFFHGVGLAYVSCSPFRVPIARLAAAQAALKSKGSKGGVGTA
jgi:pyruvate,orthophosphate dikinase